MLVYWSDGVLECWCIGLVIYWSGGVLVLIRSCVGELECLLLSETVWLVMDCCWYWRNISCVGVGAIRYRK